MTGRVGAMLQGGALLPTTTVRESVALIHALHKHPLSVEEAMERAGVADLAKQKIASLSGGQMQRARFAVAVVSNPDLLILDEPTAAMDVAARHSFWESMREFTGQGKTVVFATHYLDEADTFADRIVIMSAGRIIADGTPSEVKSVVSGRTLSFTLGGFDGLSDRAARRSELSRAARRLDRRACAARGCRCSPRIRMRRSARCSARSRQRPTSKSFPATWTTRSWRSPDTVAQEQRK